MNKYNAADSAHVVKYPSFKRVPFQNYIFGDSENEFDSALISFHFRNSWRGERGTHFID